MMDEKQKLARKLREHGKAIAEVMDELQLRADESDPDEPFGLAADQLDHALDEIDGALRWLEPEGCDCGSRYAGILWPFATDGDDSQDWIERCDDCRLFDSDVEAALALTAILGRPYRFAWHPTLDRPVPYLTRHEAD